MKSSLGFFSLRRYIVSFLAAFLITAVLYAILSVIFVFFSPSDQVYNFLIRYSGYFSASLAAFLSAVRTHKNGLITGIVCADVYMFIVIISGMILLKNSFPADSALKIFGFTSVFGGIAGILGINFKK